VTAGIIGATGYAGAELVRLLSGHPGISRLVTASTSQEGQPIDSIYPNFLPGEGSSSRFGMLESPEAAIAASDVVFGALPSGAADPYAKTCLDRGISYIDLSADFRFGGDEKTYAAWYGKGWKYPELRGRSVYGLPELNREKIRAAGSPVIIGNPGCYPTAVTLAALPALARNIHSGAAIIADAVSGVTGAGKDLARMYHFPECADSVTAYKVGAHRHSPEIERNLSGAAGRTTTVIFTPHLGPYNRGILATVYIPLAQAAKDAEQFRKLYGEFYAAEPFVRVLPQGLCAATNRVRQSNYCDISVHLSADGSTLIAIGAIDNMVKGAAGQAVQNMNIAAGFDETAGLTALPAVF